MPELGHPLADTPEHSGYSECQRGPTRPSLIKDVRDRYVSTGSNWAFFQQKIAPDRLALLGRGARQIIVNDCALVLDRMLTRAE